MIGYFAKFGDARSAALFTPYIWGPGGIGTVLEPLRSKSYGDGLALLLIQFYVVGDLPTFGPAQMTVRNYSSKNRDIAVAIPVSHAQFRDVDEEQRREFLLTSTLNAISAVQTRLKRRKVNVDFAILLEDMERLGHIFLHPP